MVRTWPAAGRDVASVWHRHRQTCGNRDRAQGLELLGKREISGKNCGQEAKIWVDTGTHAEIIEHLSPPSTNLITQTSHNQSTIAAVFHSFEVPPSRQIIM